MKFIDVLIPLFCGIYFLVFGESRLKPMDPDFARKKRLLKRLAYGLIFVSMGYLMIKLFG